MPKGRPPVLGPKAIKTIEKAIDDLFGRAKERTLGLQYVTKRFILGHRPELTLPGLFTEASRLEGAPPNLDTLRSILRVAGGYIDATRERTKARVINEVQSFLTEAHHSGVETDVETVLGGQLAEVWKETVTGMRKIIDTEANHSKNLGTLDGIIRINNAAGIEDPTVYFVTCKDRDVCEECMRLHVLPDEKTPRVWKLSALGHSYHQKGDPNPKLAGLHPHCRCQLACCAPGYGFDSRGMITYIGKGHDELAKQRGT